MHTKEQYEYMKYMPEKVEVCKIEANRFWAAKQIVYCHSFQKIMKEIFSSLGIIHIKGLEFGREGCLIHL